MSEEGKQKGGGVKGNWPEFKEGREKGIYNVKSCLKGQIRPENCSLDLGIGGTNDLNKYSLTRKLGTEAVSKESRGKEMEYSEFWLLFEKLTYEADRVDKNRDLRMFMF